jgi:hypothetical protein
MKNYCLLLLSLFAFKFVEAQVSNPAITGWIQNHNGLKGRHYVQGNSTAITDADSANVQTVYYSATKVYIRTTGVPGYVTGPFMDGNPSVATNQHAIFSLPLNPVQNTGTLSPVTMGNIGLFVNGVALFDARDGVSWNNTTMAEGGGPIPGPPGQNVWNRDAIVAERAGFDCSKGHPAQGNYHHHQNPSAFKLDYNVLSTVCNLYDADGLYAIDSLNHSPLIGFSADGFPIYGAYAFANADGTGGIVRMKTGYQLRNITTRTTYANGTSVTPGPAVSTSYPLGHYKEDYEWVAHPGQADYLDAHNGRFCVTPEYPNGIYCYFATVDANWNSAYPYVIGPTYYGVKTGAKVTSITEPVTLYVDSSASTGILKETSFSINVFPVPTQDFVAVQFNGMNRHGVQIHLFDIKGSLLQTSSIAAGSTISYLDVQTLYNGTYILQMNDGINTVTKRIVIAR